MKTFDFYLDTKVTTWYRTPFEIEAETLEEAQAQAIKFVENDHHSELSWEHIDDTIEKMSVEDNGGESTDELYYTPVGDIIWDNTKTN